MRIIDAHPAARKGKSEVVVKVSADRQPVPRAADPNAARWVSERPGLSERTVRFYEGLSRLHIAPALGEKDIR